MAGGDDLADGLRSLSLGADERSSRPRYTTSDHPPLVVSRPGRGPSPVNAAPAPPPPPPPRSWESPTDDGPVDKRTSGPSREADDRTSRDMKSPVVDRRHDRDRRRSSGRRPKNTTNFTPSLAKPDIRIVFGRSGPDDCAPPLTVHDVLFVPELFCAEHDYALYRDMLAELEASSGGEDIFQLWHGDSHVIANDRAQRGAWKTNSRMFQRVLKRIETYFGMTIAATRLNWYREGTNDWKPFHHDRAAFTPDCPQNLTVACSLGPTTREVGFEHARTGTTVFMAAPNGSAYTFSRDVNCEWKHGVIPLAAPADGGRISIIAWGWAVQDTAGSRITENDVPTARDLGLE